MPTKGQNTADRSEKPSKSGESTKKKDMADHKTLTAPTRSSRKRAADVLDAESSKNDRDALKSTELHAEKPKKKSKIAPVKLKAQGEENEADNFRIPSGDAFASKGSKNTVQNAQKVQPGANNSSVADSPQGLRRSGKEHEVPRPIDKIAKEKLSTKTNPKKGKTKTDIAADAPLPVMVMDPKPLETTEAADEATSKRNHKKLKANATQADGITGNQKKSNSAASQPKEIAGKKKKSKRAAELAEEVNINQSEGSHAQPDQSVKEDAISKPISSRKTPPEASSVGGKQEEPSNEASNVTAHLLDDAGDVVGNGIELIKDQREQAKSLLETASEGLTAAKDYVGELADGARNSIMGNIKEVAEGLVATKQKKAQTSAKQSVSKKRKGKEIEANPDPEIQANAQSASSEEEDLEEDDKTAALLQGFESSENEDISESEGIQPGQNMPSLKAKEKKELNKKLKAIKEDGEGPGVVYLGRIPHGFFEHQMRDYFNQFGTVQRLRLSRNKRTGRSKHYAFIEFASQEVAEIVSQTMNNYLMFGHILKCKSVPKEQIHENLWKGANKRFKSVPWSKIEGRKLEMGMSREGWEKRIEGEKKRRLDKAEKLKDIGYEMPSMELKGVGTIPVKEQPKAVESGDMKMEEQEKSLVVDSGENQNAVIISEEVKSRKTKKVSTKKGEKVGKPSQSMTEKAGVKKPKSSKTKKGAE